MEPPSISIPGVELLDELGRGAHSVVLRAQRGGRLFAVKIPLDVSSTADDLAARFQREAVSLARVRHPALPEVMEVGRIGRIPYIIMELASGQTLATRLRDGPLGLTESLGLARQLAGALEQIHQAGLIHRDIKPRNIVFDSQTTAVRLVDFGFVSRGLDERDPEGIGTPAYAAPEQYRGTRERVDGRADLYSLGCVFLECLMGQDAWHDARRWFQEYQNGATRGLHSRLERIPRELRAMIGRLLSRNPDERYPDATALRLALDAMAAELVGGPSGTREGNAPRMAIVGRRDEAARLRLAWGETRLTGSHIVVVRGGTGIGKTAFVHGFASEVEAADHPVLRTSAHASERQPLSVIRQLLDSYVRWTNGLPDNKRVRTLSNLRAVAGEAAPLLKMLVPALAPYLDDGAVRVSKMGEQMVVEALADLLRRLLVDISPAVVLVDDAQWIDASSHRVLGLVVERSRNMRVLFVVGLRDDASASAVLQRLLRESSSDRHTDLVLSPLNDTEITELVYKHLGAAEVDSAVVRECIGFSDRTPLGVLEVLRAMLDEGALLPHWGRWQLNRDASVQMALPSTAAEVLKRRIQALGPRTQAVLSAAAVLGTTFADDALAAMCEVSEEDVHGALNEARIGVLVESAPQGRHRFVHAAVVEALLSHFSHEQLQAAHQSAAKAIDGVNGTERDVDWIDQIESGSPDVLDLIASEFEGRAQISPDTLDALYAAAEHYAHGNPGDPERAYRVNLTAGKVAFASFDNRRALECFAAARKLYDVAGRRAGPEVDLLIAEALSRTGALSESLENFEQALANTRDPLLEARALSRIAWIQMWLNTDAAWGALTRAFEKLDRSIPTEAIGGVGSTLSAAAQRMIVGRPIKSADRRRVETLCLLYYQTARLALQTNRSARLLHATFRGLLPAERLGPSTTLVRAYLVYAFVLTALGRHGAAREYVRRTEQISRTINDPVTIAHVLEVQSVIAAWAGDLNEALAVGARCLEDYGYWLELTEYCTVALNHYQIESVRGRSLEAWKWVEKAVLKVNAHERVTVIPVFIEFAAVSALTTLGRDAEADDLLRRLRELATSSPVQSGFELTSYGPRVRALFEQGQLDSSFEELVNAFEASGQRPERAHLALAEYYVSVAHGRVQQCLAAAAGSRATELLRLKKALRDLEKTARIPMIKAHAAVIRGYYAWLTGETQQAEREFAAAEVLATHETVPWVLYAVYRGRAHLLRSADQSDAARDQALLAEAIALGHGAAYRAQVVRDEFKLSRGRRRDTQPPVSREASVFQRSETGSSASKARRYLRALLRISQATGKELDAESQALSIVDELVEALRSDRGLLFVLSADSEEEGPEKVRFEDMSLLAARLRGGHDLSETSDYDRGLLELVILQKSAELGQSHRTDDVRHQPRSMIAAPLLVRDQVVGLVYLERRLSEGIFNEDDLDALSALAAQIPPALELARTLTVRERAEENLRSVQKMEAIARLAGGIAHDFNNMLAAIRASTDMMLQQLRENALEADVRTIQGATQRAEELTRQLLAFARGQFLQAQLFQLNDRLEHLQPTFSVLLGDSIQLELRLHPKLHQVKADPAQIDQVLTNLVVNARDAMPRGGKLYIESANVVLDEGYSARNPQVKPGKYAMVSITDTGVGMDQELMSRIFEPFYTTKTDRGGTGLGLAVAYGVVTQSEGHIEVLSKKGAGTTFNVYLPLAFGKSEQPTVTEAGKRDDERVKTILLVEDEALVRESLRRALRRFGHQVLAAPDAEHALVVAREHQVELDLLITDVLMPGMNGLELAREITKFCPTIKTLYISGYTDGLLAEQGVLRERIEYLQKPISQEALRTRIDELFAGRSVGAEA